MAKITYREWVAVFVTLSFMLGLSPSVAICQETTHALANESENAATLEGKVLANSTSTCIDSGNKATQGDRTINLQEITLEEEPVSTDWQPVVSGDQSIDVEPFENEPTKDGVTVVVDDNIPADPYAIDSKTDTDIELVAQASALVASGQSGTCTWELDNKGALVICPTSGNIGKLGNWDTYNEVPWHEWGERISSVRFVGKVSCATCSCMFFCCSSLKTLDLSGLDTSKVTDMSFMFSCCSSLKSLDITALNTSRVTEMCCLFGGCSSLAKMDLTGLDTSRVTDMSSMFERCSSLKSVNLKGLDTSRVTNMSGMFNVCQSLTSLNLTGLDTSKVSDTFMMFNGCSSLKSLNLSGLDMSKVTEAKSMFDGCSSLESFKIGIKYPVSIGGALPVAANNKWWSAKTGEWYSNKQIATKRSGIADAYQRYGNLSKASITKLSAQLYTGKAIKPTPKVTMGGVTLKVKKDYTIAYQNNVAVGTASITITGTGNYKGTAKATFKIARGSLTKAKISAITTKTENEDGSSITPTPKITLDGKTLKLDRDYKLTYKNNSSAGTATVTAKGKGTYVGSISARFKIRANVQLCSVLYVKPKRSDKTAKLTKVVYQKKTPKERTLVANRDYTVRFTPAKSGQNYMIATLTGKGNYGGTATIKLSLSK